MSKYKIAWMPGDGVGHDVMEAARIVLDRLKLDAEYVPCDIGWEFWCKEGNALPDRTVQALKETTCGLFGAITSKPQTEAKEELIPELKGKGLVYFSPIVGLRQMFNLHTNMRPCKSYPGNPLNYRGNKITNPSGEDVPIDQVVFRENTEGMYGGVEFFPLPEPVYTALCANPKMKPWKDKAGLENIALSTRIMSKQGCTNICKQAFEFAKKTGRKRVTLIEKPNVLRETGGLMMRCFRDVAKGYPDIRADDANIDAICMWMFKNPQDYAVFEPTHGSAPKYAGQYKVNPIAMLLTAKMMLDWLKETEMATRLETAIARVIAEGKVRTYDVGGKDSTLEVAKAIAEYASSGDPS
jgi:3-isopropylmalate dehydrogenase